ncbi:caspase family protein [Bradyrhizobium sp. CB2312]|uniref:caspase family protein n=1 Tax=Bradyrhizobium sp. CB2312 TaxID=3039155 RepID=UPI0024B0B227|nr:caspase family protein [Bradyrhizobium sp. CB2312]WFU74265.1 caspase family protein [Bradyrhizobium sp. CB2312]
MSKKRGAVVIGVNKTGGLPALHASVRGAEDFGKWLAEEGFEVVTITDGAGPVTHGQIARAVERFVNSGTFQQLIIYFSGHGYWKNEAELWLLTDAPADANAAVSWAETAEFAKDCGIPSVVLISDACRTIPNTPRALKVRGSIIFPNEDVQRTRAKVDKFVAAAQGTSAFEAPIGEQQATENVFTHCFLQAFEKPDPDMVREIVEDGKAIKIIPNRALGKYLQREVTSLLASVNIQLNQAPDAEVLSDDDVYIGKARLQADLSGDIADVVPSPPAVHMRDVASLALEEALGQQTAIEPDEIRAIHRLAQEAEFENVIARVGTIVPEVRRFETGTGFAIVGAVISDAIVANGERPIIRSHGDDQNPGVIRVEAHLAPACTVMVRFTNGCGAALPALNEFIGHVVVDGGKIVNVSYVPSENTHRWADYSNRRERLDRLRAAAAAAAQFGVFRLNDRQRASDLAEQVRVEKGLDPTLGIYAAYAYSEADRREDVQSVLDFMVQDLDCRLFDIALLARQITDRVNPGPPVVPFCPTLTQGWNLLRARGVTLPGVLDEAQDELEPALWTTFAPARAQAIFYAIERGELGEIR